MRLLAEYLSTKVKVSKGFPEVPKLETILNFLKSNGFVEIQHTADMSPQKQMENDAMKGKDVFMYEKNMHGDEYWIRFCKAGKLSNKNPIYFVRATTDGHIESEDIAYTEYIERGRVDFKFTDYNEFVETINKIFGW